MFILGENISGNVLPLFLLADISSWLFPLLVIVILGVTFYSIIRRIVEWFSNNRKPIEKEKAMVVAKREDVRHRPHRNKGTGINIGMSRSITKYYVTFELDNDQRLEFKVNGKEYSMLSEDDVGYLEFQGTRYLDFERAGSI
ncbi:DUF2500 domain-containing protein [Evansella sp. AB-P1]|uniref:DUF2500 domain-containing protein n=1 Tax=Evansella sp. AB-P1 TaxID=3037653 RepID=UPI00241DE5C6|nr:DUF2500 domain-containing protein [Evansella sp. AB-P1]MDG5786782.1 DUF2500 domain-containing protein [Evansella sp. AB-P1]